MAVTFAEVATSRYILLTTFTKDGRPKPTPTWAVPDGDRLLVISQETSWKVKRIRNTPRVTVGPCDFRGNPRGESVEAVARILDKSQNGPIYSAINKRYGIVGILFGISSRLRGGMRDNIGIELRAADTPDDAA